MNRILLAWLAALLLAACTTPLAAAININILLSDTVTRNESIWMGYDGEELFVDESIGLASDSFFADFSGSVDFSFSLAPATPQLFTAFVFPETVEFTISLRTLGNSGGSLAGNTMSLSSWEFVGLSGPEPTLIGEFFGTQSNDSFVIDLTFGIEEEISFESFNVQGTLASLDLDAGNFEMGGSFAGINRFAVFVEPWPTDTNLLSVSAIPEPQTYALTAGLVCVAMLALRRRRIKARASNARTEARSRLSSLR